MDLFEIQCLHTQEEFSKIQTAWEEFTISYFPVNYSKTYPWLAAWWKTYHHQKEACIYISQNQEKKILSAVPLYVCWEIFGGLPVRMLHLLGNGIGTDEFLVAHDQLKFMTAVFKEICRLNWHVARFNRIANENLLDNLIGFAIRLGCSYTISDSEDFFIHLPVTYSEYLQSRTKKFRKNLNQAENRLNKMGQVEFIVLDPYADSVRVQEAGEQIASTSWQYKAGKSHFNKRIGGTLYSNLAQFKRGAGGEDFNLLLVDGRPVAYLLGCRRERTYYAIDTAFHEDFRSVSAGRILFARIIERLIIEQQVDVLDFEGAGEYKDDYANEKAKVKSIVIYNNGIYATNIHKLKESRFYGYLKNRTLKTQSPVKIL